MRCDIIVPRMGESISEATIGQILKASGSQVKAEEEILELETDKVNQVLYAPATGVLKLSIQSDETVKIGQVIGFVETGATLSPSDTQEAPPKKSELRPVAAPLQRAEMAPREAHAAGAGVRETKAAYLADLKATPGKEPKPKALPGARAEEPASQTAPTQGRDTDRETRRKLSRVRRVIAERLLNAQRTTAMLTTFNEVDLTQVMELRTRYQEAFTKRYGAKLGFMSFFVRAVVSALKDFPELNSYIDGDELVHREYYDIGIAVGTDKGLFVPVLRQCDQLTFGQIEAMLAAMARKAREGALEVDDLTGGGFTITNGGVYGSLLSTPILNPPQSGILGMHKIQERPVVVDHEVVIRPMMYTALSYDHRIVDGKQAVGFLVHVKEFLEDPARLLIEI